MTKNKNISLATLALVFAFAAPVASVRADNDTVGEKVDEAVQDTKRGTKKAARTVGEKSCELVNGKMECVGKKIKNRAKDAKDSVEDAID